MHYLPQATGPGHADAHPVATWRAHTNACSHADAWQGAGRPGCHTSPAGGAFRLPALSHQSEDSGRAARRPRWQGQRHLYPLPQGGASDAGGHSNSHAGPGAHGYPDAASHAYTHAHPGTGRNAAYSYTHHDSDSGAHGNPHAHSYGHANACAVRRVSNSPHTGGT